MSSIQVNDKEWHKKYEENMKWYITAVNKGYDAHEKKTSLKCDIDLQENQTCNEFWTIVAMSKI